MEIFRINRGAAEKNIMAVWYRQKNGRNEKYQPSVFYYYNLFFLYISNEYKINDAHKRAKI